LFAELEIRRRTILDDPAQAGSFGPAGTHRAFVDESLESPLSALTSKTTSPPSWRVYWWRSSGSPGARRRRGGLGRAALRQQCT
jgi:hypothetical protein